MFENKNVLITGGTGMIGSHLVQLLSDKANVRIVSHNRPVPTEINSKKIEILNGDLTEKAFAIKAVLSVNNANVRAPKTPLIPKKKNLSSRD